MEMDVLSRSGEENDVRNSVADILIAVSNGTCSGEKLKKVAALLEEATRIAWNDTGIRKEISA